VTRIALIRHFPTDWNREARLQGRADRPLTPEGRARLAGLRLPAPWRGMPILASPLSRARETAEALAEGRAVRLDPALVEQDWGAWEGRRAADLMAEPGSGFVPTHRLGWTERPPGGETQAELWDRVRPVLAGLAGPAVLVLHKGVMRVLLGLAGAPRDAEGMIEIKRARLYPVALGPDGTPCAPGPAVRLEPRP